LANEWRKWRVRARAEAIPFDVVDDSAPEQNLCDRMFLAQLLARAFELTREQATNQDRFRQLARFLPGPECDFADYTTLAAELGMRRGTLIKAVFDVRARYERNVDALFRESHDVDSDAALLAEKRALLACLGPFQTRARPVIECPN
ncbi:MAG TPA: hypothetical protein VGK73_09660, partial [Polyangiaceae bacterium]